MKKKLGLEIILMLFMIVSQFYTFCQTQISECDTIYEVVEIEPQFKNGSQGLFDYIKSDITPILEKCNKRDGEIISKMYVKLTINSLGNVIHVELKKMTGTKQCQTELKEKFLELIDWIPGKRNGHAVCSNYLLPISCIKWN